MLSHLLFNLTFYSLGLAFLFVLGRFDWRFRCALAFPIGVGLWGVSSGLCIVFRVNLTGLNAGLVSIVLLCILVGCYRPELAVEYKICRNKWPSCLGHFLFFSVLIIVATWFSFHHNYMFFSADTWRYIFFGDMIGKIGAIPPEHTRNLDEFTALIPLLTATGRSFGINFLPFTLFPLYGISLLIALIVLTWVKVRESVDQYLHRSMLCLFTALLCVSTPVFLAHAYYVNEHMLAGINFLIVVVSIHEYTKNEQIKWLRLAGFCMGILTLQRAEMTLFGFLPLCLLISFTQKRAVVISYLLPFLCIAYGWEIYKKITYNYTPLLARGALLYQGGLLFCYVLTVWLIGKKGLKKSVKHVASLLAVFFLAIMVASIFFAGDKSFADPMTALTELGKILFMQPQNMYCEWGLSWYFIFSIILLDFLVLRTPNNGLRMLLINILMIRILLYSFPGIFPGLIHDSSGSRILMHFFPVFILYGSMVVADLLHTRNKIGAIVKSPEN